jgi:sugar transferase EpsL
VKVRNWRLVMKRALDVSGAVGVGVCLAPLIAGVTLAELRWGNGVLFTQIRPGLNGRPFKLYKFRTMTEARDADGGLLPDADRLTSMGQTLRSWSLDELLELWNVLRGDMSLVGPRPLLIEYLDLYTDEQMRRHEMRPGLTGLAQVSGRNDQSWDDRLALDVWYVNNWSLWLDIRILAATIFKVLSREGTSAEMPYFTGTIEPGR